MVRAWHGRGMASVNQTRPHCVNQMGKTHSKPLAARRGMGTAWARHGMCESALRGILKKQNGVSLTDGGVVAGSCKQSINFGSHNIRRIPDKLRNS
jgi:hypothetical protein